MTRTPCFTMQELAHACGGKLADASRSQTPISRVDTLSDADHEAVTWIMNKHHAKSLAKCQAAAIVGPKNLLADDPRGILTEDPELAMIEVLSLFQIPNENPAPGIHPTAVVHPEAKVAPTAAVGALAIIHAGVEVGDSAIIHEGVSLCRDVRIGQNAVIHDRCVINDRCIIGNRVTIHAGSVIGADGFGYIFRDGEHRKIPQIGTVIIEDDVEIGANTCIDRAKVGATRIGRGSKIDNLVMIAHNVRTGPLCIITAQCGIAGSVRLGTGNVFGGKSGVSHGLTVGDDVKVGAGSIILKDTPDGQTLFGVPARHHITVLREQTRVRRLPKLFEKITEIEKRIAELEATANDQ